MASLEGCWCRGGHLEASADITKWCSLVRQSNFVVRQGIELRWSSFSFDQDRLIQKGALAQPYNIALYRVPKCHSFRRMAILSRLQVKDMQMCQQVYQPLTKLYWGPWQRQSLPAWWCHATWQKCFRALNHDAKFFDRGSASVQDTFM